MSKMKIKHKYIIIQFSLGVLLCCCTHVTIAQNLPELTLDEAIRTGIKNNIQIINRQYDLKSTEIQNTKAAAGYYPTLNFVAGHTHSLSNTQLSFFDGREINQKGAYSNNTNAGLGFNWNIFDANRKGYIKRQLEYFNEMSRIELQQEIALTIYNISNAYLQVLRQQSIVEQFREQLQLSNKRLDINRKTEEKGGISGIMVLQNKVNVQQDSSMLLLALSTLEQTKIELLNQMQVENIFDFQVSETSLPTFEVFDENQLYQIILKSNHALKLNHLNVLISEQRKRELKSLYYPELNLVSTFNYNLSNNQANFVTQSSNFGPAVGLSLSYPIFDNGLRKRQVKLSEIEIEKSQNNQQYLQIQLKNQLRSILNLYEQEGKLASNAEKSILLFDENLKLSEQIYQLGKLTEIEFREAQMAYYNSTMSYIIHNINQKQAFFDIHLLAGDLNTLFDY
jgi:outer membrane protein